MTFSRVVARALVPAAPRFVSALRFATVFLALALSSGLVAAENPSAPSAWLRQLRFSPNGRYILAQDDAEISVLTVQPLAVLFRMPAENATLAQFTADSAKVVFVSSIAPVDPRQVPFAGGPMHVERWRIADQSRNGVVEVPFKACGTVVLSPDGRVVACADAQGTLWLIGVASGETIVEKKKFSKGVYCEIDIPLNEHSTNTGECFTGDPGAAIIGFSPDSRFVIAEPESEGPAVAYEVNRRMELPLKGALQRLRKSSQRLFSYALPFVFVAPDLVLLDPEKGASKSDWKNQVTPTELVSFPSGTVVSKPKLPRSPQFYPAAGADFVLVRKYGPATLTQGGFRYGKTSWSAAVQFRSGDEIIINNQLALDVFGQYYVAEPNPGEVGLCQRGKGLQVAVVLHPK